MKLDRHDLLRLGVFSVSGAIIGSIYELLMIFGQRKVGSVLCIPTECLVRDTALFTKIYQLEQRAKHIDSIAYLRAVNAMDRLVMLRFKLQSGDIHYVPSDTTDALGYFEIANTNLQRIDLGLYTADTQTTIAVQTLINEIKQNLEPHLSAIMLLTRET